MNKRKIIGFQPSHNSIHHSFGRIIPNDDYIDEFIDLTRVGKISWLYNAVNMHIYKNLETIGDINKFVFKLEDADQNYEYYLQLIKIFI